MSAPLTLILLQLPVVIAAVVGVVVALSLQQRSRPAALLVAGACLLVVGYEGVGAVNQFVVLVARRTAHLSLSEVAVAASTLALVGEALLIGAIATFLAAAFVGRPAAAPGRSQAAPPRHPQHLPHRPGSPQPPPGPYGR